MFTSVRSFSRGARLAGAGHGLGGGGAAAVVVLVPKMNPKIAQHGATEPGCRFSADVFWRAAGLIGYAYPTKYCKPPGGILRRNRQCLWMKGHPVIYKSEGDLKRALQIDSWRNLSKDKMVQFTSMLPDMDKELAFKVVEQFPEFKKFALDAVDGIEKSFESALNHNKQSQENFYLPPGISGLLSSASWKTMTCPRISKNSSSKK